MQVPTLATRRRLKTRNPGIYKREEKDGTRWTFSYVDSSGKQRWWTGDSEQAALDARAELRTKRNKGEVIAPSRITLGAFVDEWIENPPARLRASTVDLYKTHLRNHVVPRLGKTQLSRLTTLDVSRLADDLTRAGKAPHTVRGVLTALSHVCKAAIKAQLLAVNPLVGLDREERPPQRNVKERRVLTSAEVAALLSKATAKYRPILATIAFTGIRTAEALGLVWGDLDLDGGVMYVRRQLNRKSKYEDVKTESGKREIELFPELVHLLREHRKEAFARGIADPDRPVFASRTGTPLYWRNVTTRGLTPAAEKAGLLDEGKPPLGMHSLRHTYCSHLIVDLRLDAVQVATRAGHAKPSITIDTYAHDFDRARHSGEFRAALAGSDYAKALS